MTANPGEAAFLAFQCRRYAPADRVPWRHDAVAVSRPAWEDAGNAAIGCALGPGMAAVFASLREYQDLLAEVRKVLADSSQGPADARRQAIELIQNAKLTEQELVT
jgi:hypothetical protein